MATLDQQPRPVLFWFAYSAIVLAHAIYLPPLMLIMASPWLWPLPLLSLAFLVALRWPGMTRRKRVTAAIGLLLWAAYTAYEIRMWYWMQTVIAPIRVDLLVLMPLMLIISLAIVLGTRRPKDRAPDS
jgi:hypothetical protein